MIAMRALTIWQPWAGLIAAGIKTVENRNWPPPEKIIGTRIAIRAGKTFDRQALFTEVLEYIAVDPELTASQVAADIRNLVKPEFLLVAGAVIATAVVTGYVRPYEWASSQVDGAAPGATADDLDWWVNQQYGWLLRDVVRLPRPIPARGAQKLWTWEAPDGVEP